MTQDLTSIEAIGLGIRSEEDAAKYYGHIAKMIQNPDIKEKYETLAKEEVNHAKKLTELYKEMSGEDEKAPRIPGDPETAEKGVVPDNISNSFEDLLKLAIEREQQAQVFYYKAAKDSTNASGEKIFRELAKQEEHHEALLKKELEIYLTDADGYLSASDEEFVHVGP